MNAVPLDLSALAAAGLSRAEALAVLCDAALRAAGEAEFGEPLAHCGRLAEFYDANQPRDTRGRWTQGAGDAMARDHSARAVKDFLAGGGAPSPGELRALGAHLSRLTVAQLRDLKREHGIRPSGPDKERLVAAVAKAMAEHRGKAAPAVMPSAARVTHPEPDSQPVKGGAPGLSAGAPPAPSPADAREDRLREALHQANLQLQRHPHDSGYWDDLQAAQADLNAHLQDKAEGRTPAPPAPRPAVDPVAAVRRAVEIHGRDTTTSSRWPTSASPSPPSASATGRRRTRPSRPRARPATSPAARWRAGTASRRRNWRRRTGRGRSASGF